ncbi:MAG: hypothetical protein J2P47_15040, partial [Acetobacteraceae bacterium]|nr:hypothetical protein [Acetobacteraceae bacterium]
PAASAAFSAHADVNAAINIRDAGLGIRRWNTPSLRVEDGRWAAVETRTTQGTSSPGGAASGSGGNQPSFF